jgi:hypothetical protein
LFSLRPESIRLASEKSPGYVRVRGTVRQQTFHGATELIRVECADGSELVVRTSGSSGAGGEVDLEFNPIDAIPVRESAERV